MRREGKKSVVLQDQKERDKLLSEYGKNFFVRAGAGAGKTTILTQRIKKFILNNPDQAQYTCAITFTKNSAEHLRRKIRALLEKEGREQSEEVLSQIFIGTFHSYCQSLLKDFDREGELFKESDLIESEGEKSLILKSFMEESFLSNSYFMNQVNQISELERLKKDKIIEIISKALPYSVYKMPVETVSKVKFQYAYEKISELYDLYSQYCQNQSSSEFLILFLHQYGREKGISEERARERVLILYEKIDQFLQKGETLKKIVRPKEWGKVSKDKINQFLCEWYHFVKSDVAYYRAYLYKKMVHLISHVRRGYRQYRQEKGIMFFDDLIDRTQGLLRKDKKFVQKVKARWKYFYIDEFQDTDIFQIEIFSRLSLYEDQLVCWEKGHWRPGALFLVGDPQQSIYRFRGADMEAYNYMEKILVSDKNGEKVILSSNFRSDPCIGKWVNAVFSQDGFFGDRASSYQSSFSELFCQKKLEGACVLRLDEGKGQSQGDVLREQIFTLSENIWLEIKSGKLGYRDYLILCPTNQNVRVIKNLLTEQKVPLSIPLKDGNKEVILCLLNSLLYPYDRALCVSVLKSPLYNISDEKLYSWVKNGGVLRGGNRIKEKGSESNFLIQKALNQLERMYHWSLSKRGWNLWEKLKVESHLEYFYQFKGQSLEWEKIDENMMWNLNEKATLKEIIKVLEGDNEEVVREDKEGVQVMTIHSAKGLEADTVILMGSSEIRKEASRALYGEGESRVYFSFKSLSKEGRTPMESVIQAEPLDWKSHQLNEQKHLDAEKVRLQYVAVTRACRRLIVTFSQKGKGLWKSFFPYIEDKKEWNFENEEV